VLEVEPLPHPAPPPPIKKAIKKVSIKKEAIYTALLSLYFWGLKALQKSLIQNHGVDTNM
jgi:hypothetical protein